MGGEDGSILHSDKGSEFYVVDNVELPKERPYEKAIVVVEPNGNDVFITNEGEGFRETFGNSEK